MHSGHIEWWNLGEGNVEQLQTESSLHVCGCRIDERERQGGNTDTSSSQTDTDTPVLKTA
jgi:hypothetical protein